MGLEDFNSRFFEADASSGSVVATFFPGRLDEEHNVEELGQSLFQLIDQYGYRQVALDLTQTSFVTSAVLGKLITLHRRLHRADGRLVLCGLQQPVETVMRRSNLLSYFQVVDSRDDAINWLDSTD
jgi:anti-sigma B factor antagonist